MTRESPSAWGDDVTAIWAFGPRLSRHDFDEFRAGRVEQCGTDVPSRENHPQRLGIGLHLRPMCGWDLRVAVRNAASLEVEHRYAVLFDQQPVGRPGDHAT